MRFKSRGCPTLILTPFRTPDENLTTAAPAAYMKQTETLKVEGTTFCLKWLLNDGAP